MTEAEQTTLNTALVPTKMVVYTDSQGGVPVYWLGKIIKVETISNIVAFGTRFGVTIAP